MISVSFKRFFSWFAFSVFVLSLTVAASAQWRDDDYDDDDYGRNGGYSRDRNRGGYNNSYNRLEQTVRNLKSASRSFRRVLDRELDNSRVNGRSEEDRLNAMAKRFDDAVRRMNSSIDSDRDYRENQNRFQSVLNQATELDRWLNRMRRNYNVQNEWNQVSSLIDVLYNEYRYNGNNGGWNNGRGNGNGRGRGNNGGWNNGNGSWRDKFPIKLPF